MAYGGEQCEAMKKTQYYGKHTVVLPEGIMLGMPRQERYGTTGYGAEDTEGRGPVRKGL